MSLSFKHFRVALLAAALATVGASAHAATFTWQYGQVDAFAVWSNPAAWSVSGVDGDGLPDSDDIVQLNATSLLDATIDSDFTVNQLVVAAGYTGVLHLGAGVTLKTMTALTVDTINFDALAGRVQIGGGSVSCLAPLGDVEIVAGTASVTLLRDLQVAGRFVLTSVGALTATTPKLLLAGDATVNDADLTGTAVVSFVGAADQDLDGSGRLAKLDVSKPSGNLVLPAPFPITLSLTGTAQAHIVGELRISGATSASFLGLIDTLRIASTLTLAKNLLVTTLFVDTGSAVNGLNLILKVTGDVTCINAAFTGTAYISFIGDTDQTLSGNGRLTNVDVSKTAGDLILPAPFRIFERLSGTAQAHIVGEVLVNVSHFFAFFLGSLDKLTINTATGEIHLYENLRVTELVIENVFKLTDNAGRLQVTGNATVNDADFNGTAFVSFIGATNQVLTGSGRLTNLDVTKTGGDLILPTPFPIIQTFVGTLQTHVVGELRFTGVNILAGCRGRVDTLRINVTGIVTLNGQNLVVGDLIIENINALNPMNLELQVFGNATINDADFNGAAFVSFVGASDQILTGTGRLTNLDVSKTGGNLVLPTPFPITAQLTGTTQAHIVGELRFKGPVTAKYYGYIDTLRIDAAGTSSTGAITLNWDIAVTDLFIDGCYWIAGNGARKIEVFGNLTSNHATLSSGSVQITFVGATDQVLTGTGQVSWIDVSKTGGNVILPTPFRVSQVLSGTPQAHMVGELQFAAPGQGSVTARYDGLIDTLRINQLGAVFINKILQVGDLVITGVSLLNSSAAGNVIRVNGQLTQNDPDLSGSAIISLTGDAAQYVGGSGAVLTTLDISKTAGVVTIAPAFANSFTTLTAGGYWDMRGATVTATTITINTHGILAGDFTVNGPVTVKVSGMINPDPIVRINGPLAMLAGSKLFIDNLSGAPSDKVVVNGTVNLNGTLAAGGTVLQGTSGGPPRERVVIIENDLAEAVSNRFGGLLNNGSPTTIDGQTYYVQYAAGDGNDVAVYPPDGDNDGIGDAVDNCLTTANSAQTNTDGDAQGDTCDGDDDNDGVPDTTDNSPLVANPDQSDSDGDGEGDASDLDDDGDGVPDGADLCPLAAGGVNDLDGDGCADGIDSDGDGVADADDACPLDATRTSGLCVVTFDLTALPARTVSVISVTRNVLVAARDTSVAFSLDLPADDTFYLSWAADLWDPAMAARTVTHGGDGSLTPSAQALEALDVSAGTITLRADAYRTVVFDLPGWATAFQVWDIGLGDWALTSLDASVAQTRVVKTGRELRIASAGVNAPWDPELATRTFTVQPATVTLSAPANEAFAVTDSGSTSTLTVAPGAYTVVRFDMTALGSDASFHVTDAAHGSDVLVSAAASSVQTRTIKTGPNDYYIVPVTTPADPQAAARTFEVGPGDITLSALATERYSTTADATGVTITADGCPADPLKFSGGLCGCGVPDLDSDGDSVADCQDGCPGDPAITTGACSVCGNGTVEATEACDDGNTNSGDCCSASCDFEPAATVCRAAGGACDLAESCDGAGHCPADLKSIAVCRAAAGACDLTEACDGAGDDCPADLKSTAVCRAANGECDVAEACDGASAGCPADLFDAPGAACGDGTDNACRHPDSCDGEGACRSNDETADADGDLALDCADGCPADASKLVPGTCGCGVADDDSDSDSHADCNDNCPADANADQVDLDGGGGGDACDADDDGDGVADADDNCAQIGNPSQSDIDGSGGGDACDDDDDGDGIGDGDDNCPSLANDGQTNTDGDALGDACDTDDDNDDVLDSGDNCPLVTNFDQQASDFDGAGDACDVDDDGDGVLDDDDNCPMVANPDNGDDLQIDTDSDGLGDACDEDDDGDLIADVSDNCQLVANNDQANNDGGSGDACDPNDDNDAFSDAADNCPFVSQPDQSDADSDGSGDACDGDDDGDGVLDGADNCPLAPNADQLNTDGGAANGDALGDACDDDDDSDGEPDDDDNCPTVANPGTPVQADLDQDGFGDACDADDDGDDANDDVDNCRGLANANQGDNDEDGLGDACDGDDDDDGIADESDNCPLIANPDQVDSDSDGEGDAGDADDDGDSVLDTTDNCPLVANPDQADPDGDGQGSACDDDDDGDDAPDASDNCPLVGNPDQADNEPDGSGDACDPDDDNDRTPDADDGCPLVADADQSDLDGDGLGDACDLDADGDGVSNMIDNCPGAANGHQADGDDDGTGDACDGDTDGDGVDNTLDNCPDVANAQTDLDGDGVGDSCDADIDGDGSANADDTCALVANGDQADLDGDGAGDVCDADDDGDGVIDALDDCPLVADPSQSDSDGDGQGDACDPDDDQDGAYDGVDNCAGVANPSQTDSDGDGQGNDCDEDADGDGVLDGADNCPTVVNVDQADVESDDVGDACDGDADNDGVSDALDQCPGTPLDAPIDPGAIPGYRTAKSGTEGVDDEGRYTSDHVRGQGAEDLAFDDATGCSIDQLCPCAGPRGTDLEWKNQGAFVSCVTQTANSLARRGLISDDQKGRLVQAAAHSECGSNPCRGKSLANQSAAGAPYLVVTLASFHAWGAAPTTAAVYAGTTQVRANSQGELIIPMVGANGQVIVDALDPAALNASTIPNGALFVLRRGGGKIVLGLKGFLASGDRVSVDATVRIVNGQRGANKNLSLEGAGNDYAVLGRAGEDEFLSGDGRIRLLSTVTVDADLMAGQVCR